MLNPPFEDRPLRPKSEDLQRQIHTRTEKNADGNQERNYHVDTTQPFVAAHNSETVGPHRKSLIFLRRTSFWLRTAVWIDEDKWAWL